MSIGSASDPSLASILRNSEPMFSPARRVEMRSERLEASAWRAALL
jgi:hypothetical protein